MRKKLLALLFCIGLMLIFLPQVAQAADDYIYIDANGDTKTTAGLTVTPVMADTATLSSGWYVVSSGVTRNGTITVSGNVHLILTDGFTLSVTGSADNAGIRVSTGNSLSIYGQAGGTGTINAQGGINGAGIGGGKNSSSGTITINSGSVTAIGGNYGAGIGGGYYGNGGTISIAGGTVNATGGNAGVVIEGTSLHTGAGIGGGYNGVGGTITISGGTVNAVSGPADTATGAGIGGGSGKDGGRITISGGNVTANSAKDGAGLGGGAYGSGGIILISGGDVTARSTYRGAGIGGGLIYADGGSITISGGTVKAYGGDQGGSGIGGASYSAGGTVKIQGGSVEATGGLWGAGIGGGYGGNGGAITISSGTIKAYAGSYGAGIGAGGTNTAGSHNGGTIKILGGKVTARGGGTGMDKGLDIGRGRNGVNGTLLIDDTAQVTLAANGIDSSATTLGACILQGPAAGSLSGAYEDGTKITGTLIDMGSETLSGGTGYTVSGDTVTLSGSGNSYVLFGSTTSRNVVVSSGSSANLALFAADIQPASGCAFNMSGAFVDMRLVRSNTLVSTSGFAGLQAPVGSVLTISGSATATLTTQGGQYGAGIGGSSGAGGNITISGGTVTAYGGGSSAGIGGGERGAGGSITINGGTVEARGGQWTGGLPGGSGIGGGVNGGAGVITISNGNVKSWGGGDGAGIGGTGGTITISGGTVTAYGGSYGAGIGGSWSRSAGNIFISGGTVMAQGGSNGSGIGGGGSGGTGGSVAIIGGTITAYGGSASHSGGGGAGIGGGGGTGSIGNGSASGTVTISGSATVTACGSDGGAGIGGGGTSGGVGGAGGTLLADGANATVSATGIGSGYDIGSGNSNTSGGTLSVTNNATVMMNGNGTNANTSFITGTVGGHGAGLLAGSYLNSQKLLTFSSFEVSPNSGADAFDTVTLNAAVDGISDILPEGLISFKANGAEIGQCSVTRTEAGSSQGVADLEWTTIGGTYTFTIQYVQNDISDSYYMAGSEQITGYTVSRITQAALSVSDPGILTYGDAPFDLIVSDGSGIGALSYAVTLGDAVSVNASGQVTVEKAGTATVTVTKAADDNYEEAQATVDITVGKATPAAVIFPTSSAITYGAKLSSSELSGGSGDGSFAWESPDTVPTVNNSGHKVIFTPRDADNYDYTGVTLESTVGISVNKAVPSVTFPTAETITYGAKLSASALTGGSGDGSFAWENPDIVPPVINSGYSVIFTPDNTDNYLTVEQNVSIIINKAEQATLSIGGIPEVIRYGDADFTVSVNGGNGSGSLSYQITSGDTVAVDAAGKVSVLKPGTAVLTVSKAADSNYISQQQTAQIDVSKGIQTSLSLSGIPSTIRYGDTPFDLTVSGGSGTGALSFAVTEGDAVSVDANGQVTVVKAGMAAVTVTKAEDNNYETAHATVDITVGKATPAAVVFPTSSVITYGAKLSSSVLSGGSGDGSFEWENPDTVPIVNNSGYQVIFTPRDADNYDYTSVILESAVGISVSKAVPTVTFPTALPITYGAKLSASDLKGGSGDGSFAWENPDIVPPVINSGYSVIFTPSDTDNYLTVEQNVSIIMNKAEQSALAVSGIPEVIRYGDADFTVVVSGGNGAGALSYQVTSGDAVAVDVTGKVSVLKPGTAVLTVTKEADSNYISQQQTAQISVGKGIQTFLSLSGIPSTIRYGDTSFDLIVSGGSGTGALSFAVTEGDAVSVDANGQVMVEKAGTATVTVTKAGDHLYNKASVSAKIQVKDAVPLENSSNEPTPLPSAKPSSPTPTVSAAPSSTQTPLPNTRTISGTLVDSNGKPLAGYVVELHSDPITTITDTDGHYTFYNVDYTDHKLIVKTPKGEEITAFKLSFLEDDIFGANITKKGVDITFTKSTVTVDIQVIVDADQGGAAISQVLSNEIPETSHSFWGIDMLLWIGGIVGLVIIAALFIISRKRKVNDIYD
jgi:hypothetical protein